MIAAITITAGFVLPMLIALLAAMVSIAAFRRHMTMKQLLFSVIVVGAGFISGRQIVESLSAGGNYTAWPLILIAAAMLLALVQMGLAIVFGAVNRLRQLAAA